MRWADSMALSAGALRGNMRRTILIGLATAIGVSSVLLLTSLGQGVRHLVIRQFETLGTNLLIVAPGRSETVGGAPPMLGTTPRDLTLGDALALARHPAVAEVAPVVLGAAPVSVASGLERELTILGSTAALRQVRHLKVGQGKFLPDADPRRPAAVCVLGYGARRALFGNRSAYGRWVRIGDRRFRVIGVLAQSAVSIGLDLDDVVIVPVGSAQALFDQESLFRILVQVRSGTELHRAARMVSKAIAARHEGENDVTVITQDSVVNTLGRVLRAVTVGIAVISAISLAVAGILIMNVMLVSVAQRGAEIGLLKALGARSRDVRALFLIEAVLLASLGALSGVVVGVAGTHLVRLLYRAIPVEIPLWAFFGASGAAVVVGLVFGLMPARRAAMMDPVDAMAQR